MEGDHRYCACFTFYEKCSPTKSKSRAVKSTSREGFKDGSQSDSSLSDKRFSDGIPGISVNSEEFSVDMFAPKCLCLVSRASYFDILKVQFIFRNRKLWAHFSTAFSSSPTLLHVSLAQYKHRKYFHFLLEILDMKSKRKENYLPKLQ